VDGDQVAVVGPPYRPLWSRNQAQYGGAHLRPRPEDVRGNRAQELAAIGGGQRSAERPVRAGPRFGEEALGQLPLDEDDHPSGRCRAARHLDEHGPRDGVREVRDEDVGGKRAQALQEDRIEAVLPCEDVARQDLEPFPGPQDLPGRLHEARIQLDSQDPPPGRQEMRREGAPPHADLEDVLARLERRVAGDRRREVPVEEETLASEAGGTDPVALEEVDDFRSTAPARPLAFTRRRLPQSGDFSRAA
jgi:hypothetical protein